MKNIGFGKTILFGEHFVVYGLPAIASAIGDYTEARVEKTNQKGWSLKDERPATPGYKKEKMGHQKDSINRVIKAAGLPWETGMKIWLGGPLYAASGVGASAASCTALARAISSEFGLGFDDEKINGLAFEGEKGYHGTPSGIDNTAATYGGLLWFRKGIGGKANTMERISIKEPVEIVIANTGIVANTKKAVAGVKERKDKSPGEFEKIFSEYGGLAAEARAAIEKGDWKKTGALMDKNHGLLQKIGVSCNELDALAGLARNSGALGAKLTGGGLGGLVLALAPGKSLQDKVASEIEGAGFTAWKTTIG